MRHYREIDMDKPLSRTTRILCQIFLVALAAHLVISIGLTVYFFVLKHSITAEYDLPQ